MKDTHRVVKNAHRVNKNAHHVVRKFKLLQPIYLSKKEKERQRPLIVRAQRLARMATQRFKKAKLEAQQLLKKIATAKQAVLKATLRKAKVAKAELAKAKQMLARAKKLVLLSKKDIKRAKALVNADKIKAKAEASRVKAQIEHRKAVAVQHAVVKALFFAAKEKEKAISKALSRADKLSALELANAHRDAAINLKHVIVEARKEAVVQMNVLKAKMMKEVRAVHNETVSEIKALEKEHARDIAELEDDHEDDVTQLKQACLNRTKTLKTKMTRQHALQISVVKDHLGGKHASIVAHLKKIHAKDMEDCDCADVIAPTSAPTKAPVVTTSAPTKAPVVTTSTPTTQAPITSAPKRVAPTKSANN